MKPQCKHSNRWIPFAIVLIIVIFALILFDPLHWIVEEPHETVILVTDQAGGITQIVPTLTPLPTDYPLLIREYFENEKQTDALIIGATIIVLITLVLVLLLSRRERKSGNEKSK